MPITLMILFIGTSWSAQKISLAELRANTPTYLGKEVEFDAEVVTAYMRHEAHNYDIKIADADQMSVIVWKDSPLFQKVAIDSPIKMNDSIRIIGDVKKYTNQNAYYISAKSIETTSWFGGSLFTWIAWIVGGIAGLSILSSILNQSKEEPSS